MANLTTWNPEDASFWASKGKRIANKNLFISVFCLILAFIVWQIWSVVATRLNDVGFHLTKAQLFTLAGLPGLSGATLRILYTFMPGLLGGKRWTIISTSLLLIPAIGIGFAVQDPTTPFSTLVILASLCGLGGGALSSSTATLNPFFPKHAKGTANGINVGVGNLGVSVVQFVTPIIIGVASIGALTGGGQIMKNGKEIFIQNAAFIWVVPIVIAVLFAIFGMDSTPANKVKVTDQLAVLGQKHFWLMTILYVMCFGSFIGFGAAFPLLIKAEFPEVNAAQLAFLGPLVGASFRPIGGWLSDKVNSGAKVTFWDTVLMLIATASVMYFLGQHNFTGFLLSFLVLFASTGIANGSTFRMMPFLFKGTQASSAMGLSAAIAAYGAYFIPKFFGWYTANTAFTIFLVYYVVSLIICFAVYSRKGAAIKS